MRQVSPAVSRVTSEAFSSPGCRSFYSLVWFCVWFGYLCGCLQMVGVDMVPLTTIPYLGHKIIFQAYSLGGGRRDYLENTSGHLKSIWILATSHIIMPLVPKRSYCSHASSASSADNASNPWKLSCGDCRIHYINIQLLLYWLEQLEVPLGSHHPPPEDV